MRKRGFIILVASLPLWVVNVILWRNFEKVSQQWAYELNPPDFLRGASWALILVTLTAFAFLSFDFLRWLRARHHPSAKSD